MDSVDKHWNIMAIKNEVKPWFHVMHITLQIFFHPRTSGKQKAWRWMTTSPGGKAKAREKHRQAVVLSFRKFSPNILAKKNYAR